MSIDYAIRLPRSIRSEPIMMMAGLGGLAAPGVYSIGDGRLRFSRSGAICVLTSAGDWFGIKPGEFEWVSTPHPVWHADGRTLHAFEYGPALVEVTEALASIRAILDAANIAQAGDHPEDIAERVRWLVALWEEAGQCNGTCLGRGGES